MFQKLKELFVGTPTEERVEPVIVPEIEEEVIPEGTGELIIKALAYDDETGQIKIEMDWDDDFVAYLKRNGFNGVDDESIVQRYVATLYQNIASRHSEEGKDFE